MTDKSTVNRLLSTAHRHIGCVEAFVCFASHLLGTYHFSALISLNSRTLIKHQHNIVLIGQFMWNRCREVIKLFSLHFIFVLLVQISCRYLKFIDRLCCTERYCTPDLLRIVWCFFFSPSQIYLYIEY